MMERKSFTWLFVACVVLIPTSIFGVVKWIENNHLALPLLGEKGHRVKEFSLTDQNNLPFTQQAWKGKIVVANLFFTHCPVVCPKMTRNLKRVQEVMIRDKELFITSFSVDPERDSAARLMVFMKKMGVQEGNWSFVTGDKKAIYSLARNSLLLSATDGDGGPQDFIHSDRLVLIDKENRIRGFYDGTRKEDTEKLLKDIMRLKEE